MSLQRGEIKKKKKKEKSKPSEKKKPSEKSKPSEKKKPTEKKKETEQITTESTAKDITAMIFKKDFLKRSTEDLRNLCVGGGLPVSGTKNQLVDRLLESMLARNQEDSKKPSQASNDNNAFKVTEKEIKNENIKLETNIKRPATDDLSSDNAKRVKFTPTKKIAIIIGNAAYRGGVELKSTRNDVVDLENILKQFGFEVRSVLDANRAELLKSVTSFVRVSKQFTVNLCIFFYIGYAINYREENYLLPIADYTSEDDIKANGIKDNEIIQELAELGPSTKTIFVLDACRNIPFLSTSALNKGLKANCNGQNILMAYSASPNKTTIDGSGRNSLFTKNFIENMIPNVKIQEIFIATREAVYKETSGQQIPWSYDCIIGNTFFK